MNPYAAPQVDVMPTATADEHVRQLHINTEATIKSIGTLYYLGAFVGVLVSVASLATMTRHGPALETGVALFLGAFGAVQGVLAYGLRRLLPWTRIPVIVLSCLGLLAFPIGTIISIYFIATLAGKKGQLVMTPEYRRIIAATPHIKRKTSIFVWVLLVLLIVVLIGVIASAIYG